MCIRDSIYMMQNSLASGNSTFVITDEGVLVFDADLRSGDQVLAAIRRLTDKKVKYLVVSHPAGDHSTGAWIYREDKPLFITTRKQMRDLHMQEGEQFRERQAGNEPQYGPYKGAELVLPDMAFESALTLRMGCLLYTSPSPRDRQKSRMPSSA